MRHASSPSALKGMKSMRAICFPSLLAALILAASPRAAAPLENLGPVAGKVLWVDFWASWCTPCRRSFPWLNEMHTKYAARGLQIIAVNLDTERAAAERFLEETPAEFALRFDPSGTLAKEFDVQAMPSSYVLDAAGNVLSRHFGFKLASARDYEEAIVEALAGVERAGDESSAESSPRRTTEPR
jgi:thiol-disulfide isomerase/thioredoxin